MKRDRRKFLQHSASLSLGALAWTAGLISPAMVKALELENAFAEKSAGELIEQLANRLEIRPSERIQLSVPEVAENGAIVPVTIASSLENLQSLALIAAKNPVPLVARITLKPGTEPFVQARVKMAESSHLIVLVNAGDRLYSARKFVQVTVGGCGT